MAERIRSVEGMPAVAERRGMGRGLAAILSVAPGDEPEPELRELAVELIEPNPRQPRERFDEEALVALAGSLTERGSCSPCSCGRARAEATSSSPASAAGARRGSPGSSTAARVVRPDDDAASLELALIENMAREDLNPLEEARACAALVEELGFTREEVGRRVGRSRVAVSNLLRLLDLPDEVLELLAGAGSPRAMAARCCCAPTTTTAAAWPREAADRGWSVRELEDRARSAGGPRQAPPRPPRPRIAPRRGGRDHRRRRCLGAALGAEVSGHAPRRPLPGRARPRLPRGRPRPGDDG